MSPGYPLYWWGGSLYSFEGILLYRCTWKTAQTDAPDGATLLRATPPNGKRVDRG